MSSSNTRERGVDPRTLAMAGLDWFSQRRHGTRVFSLVRIGYGVTTVFLLLINLPVRQQIWGAEAAYTWELFMQTSLVSGQPSLFVLSSSAVYADILYFALLAAAILFTLGWHTRTITVIFFVLLWSLHARNPLATNGGDNLARIILVYMVFAQVGAQWSLDSLRGRRRLASGTPRRREWVVGTVAHNAARLACIAQVCVLYATSSLFKVQGEMWQNGTAVYYILRTAEYNTWPEVTAFVYEFPIVVVGATYAAVFVQLCLPLALVNRWAKAVLLPLVLGMHVAIGIFMGLPFFSLFMVMTDLFFLTDRDVRLAKVFVAGYLARFWMDRPGKLPSLAAPELVIDK
ncbi:hypothetical protein ADILRU_0919 [Leifsonia rubra CMS 76R]|nr:hypothetical protein ADILRU_0919 [Leifsonia rubra CMS 76R]